jgi:phytoene dehydrogenase-like protein
MSEQPTLVLAPLDVLARHARSGHHRLDLHAAGSDEIRHGKELMFERLRAGSRSALGALYPCGGSTHPGAGVATAAWSGRLSANAVLQETRIAS